MNGRHLRSCRSGDSGIQQATDRPEAWRFATHAFIALVCVSIVARPTRGQEVTSTPAVDQPSADTDDPKSSPEALSVYSQAATFQNNRAFDLAAESWQTFLKDFLDDPKAVDAHYNLGVCYLELKEFAKARESLQHALASTRKFDRREDAYLNLGWAIYTLALQDQTELFPAAEQAFVQLLAEFPKGQYGDQAWFLRGESLYMQGKREEAEKAYQQLVRDYPDSDLLANGLYALGVTREELKLFEKAGEIYDRFLSRFTDNPLVSEVRMRKAETVLQLGDLAAAEKLFGDVAKTDDFAQADHARFRQAFCVSQQERFADAAELFSTLARDFPESRYRQPATMAAARAYFRAEVDAKASEWFDKLLDGNDAMASEAAHWRVRLLLKAGESEAALVLVDRFLAVAESKKHAFATNLRMDQADATYEIPDRRRQAMELYERLAREFPDHSLAPQALYDAAFSALELKDYRNAQRLTEDFLAKYTDHRLEPDVQRVAAESHLQLGDAATAAKLFSELADDQQDASESSRLRLRQAVSLYADKKYADVLQQLTPRLDSFRLPEQRAEALHLMGMSHFAQEQFEVARGELRQSLSTLPEWRQADETLLYLSRAERHLENDAEARGLAEKLLHDFPKSAVRDQATFRLAEYCYAVEDYPSALRHYQAVVQDWPDSSFVPFALYGDGWSQLRQSRYAEAQAAFGQLLSRFPDHSIATSALYARALARQQAGQFDESLKDLEEYLPREVSRRERSDALYVRGLCLLGLKKPAEAIESFQSILRDDPDGAASEKVRYELAWAYRGVDQPNESEATFQELARRYPQGDFAAEALYHVGEAHYDREVYDEAVVAYEQARGGSSGAKDLDEKIRYKLGWALYQKREFADAQAAFADQLNTAPDGELAGDALFMQGECLFKQGKYQEALPLYDQARQRSLSSEQITTLVHLHAGQATAQLQQWQASYDWLAAIAKKYPESPLLLQIGFELAVAQQNLGNMAEAERLFGSIADRATGELSARARFMLGEVRYAKQEHVQAIREFRKVMFGFDPAVDPPVAPWQAKAGFEAGQCAGILAGQQTGRAARQQYLELAMRFFQYVQTRHDGTDEAVAAAEQLKKYGLAPKSSKE